MEDFTKQDESYRAYQKGLEDGKPKWIPVAERLPDLELVEVKANDFDLYACLCAKVITGRKNHVVVVKAWYDGTHFMDSDCIYITKSVTHWMPLPEPPKGE